MYLDKIPNSRRKLLNLFLCLQASVEKISQLIWFSPMALLQTIPTTLQNIPHKIQPSPLSNPQNQFQMPLPADSWSFQGPSKAARLEFYTSVL